MARAVRGLACLAFAASVLLALPSPAVPVQVDAGTFDSCQATPVDPLPNITTGLSTCCSAGNGTRIFDESALNKSLVHRFDLSSMIPPGHIVDSATLSFRSAPDGAGSEGDDLSWKFIEPTGINAGDPIAGTRSVTRTFSDLAGAPWNPANFPEIGTLCTTQIIDTIALNDGYFENEVLRAIGDLEVLDVHIQDDTRVDRLRLSLNTVNPFLQLTGGSATPNNALVLVSVENSPDPTDVGVSFPTGTAHQYYGIWTKTATTGTITIDPAVIERFVQKNFDLAPGSLTVEPGTWSTTFTIDLATGRGRTTATGQYRLSPGDPTLLTFMSEGDSDGPPLLTFGAAGDVAGFEELGASTRLFCTDNASQLGPGGCGDNNGSFPFGTVPGSAYDPLTGLLNMPTAIFNPVTGFLDWSNGGDVRLLPEPILASALGTGALCVAGLARRRRRT